MNEDLIIELIKEVQHDLTNQINNLGEKLSTRINALENVRKQRRSFIKIFIIPLIVTVLGGCTILCIQDSHLKVTWQHVDTPK